MKEMTTEAYLYEHEGTTKFIYRAPNQRILQIHLLCVGNHKSINYSAHIKARAILSKNAFLLFDYLEFMPDGLVWALSSSKLYKETTLTEQTYAKAFKELIEKGYLVKEPIASKTGAIVENAYHFFEDPDAFDEHGKIKVEVLRPSTRLKPSAIPKKSSCANAADGNIF